MNRLPITTKIMDKLPLTEKESAFQNIEKMSTSEILIGINTEDAKVAIAVADCLTKIETLVDAIHMRMSKGGRLFYIGAGTSGRLGILDASECPPTFGVSHGLVSGIIAGGDGAIRKAVEFAEDDSNQAWLDLATYQLNDQDSIVGIAASGTTPYVAGGLKIANENGLLTGCITCSPGSPIGEIAQYPIEVNTGPEFITGSTRMKAGTAQKMILNMITTAVMIKLGKVKGNRMVDMQLSNEKLEKRGTRMIVDAIGVSSEEAFHLLKQHGSVRAAISKASKS